MEKNNGIGTAEKILDAAEFLFAQSSYNEVTIRKITEKAGVRLALSHYYFGSKDQLFRAVIRRRSGALNQMRFKMLSYYRQLNHDQPLTVLQLIESFTIPYLYLALNGGEHWRSYLKIVSRLLTSSPNPVLGFFEEIFAPTVQIFIQEFRQIMPDVSDKKLFWAFDFLMGSLSNMCAEIDHIKNFSDGQCSVDDILDTSRHLFAFICAGFNAVVNNEPCDLSSALSIACKLHV